MDNIGTLYGRPIGQYWQDLALWEELLNELDYIQSIVEFGTWQGGMSAFLWSQAVSRGITFQTFDINYPNSEYPIFYTFYKANVITQFYDVKKRIPMHKDLILFCDGGNKLEEVIRWEDSGLTHRSIIAVHDWGTEFIEENIPRGWRIFKSSQHTVFLIRDEYMNERVVGNA